jgi:hypothetical protein
MEVPKTKEAGRKETEMKIVAIIKNVAAVL